jgi:myb proto-oncogene protein
LKKKLNKLQTSTEGNHRDGFSPSQSITRGQWERRLQTDIHMAKQALSEALSPEKPSNCLSDLKPSNECFSKKPEAQSSSTYASSTENIARLLKGWMRNSPKSARTNSAMTQNSLNNMSGTDSASSEGSPSTKANKNGIELSEAFESLFGFESFESSHSDTSQSMSPEASLFQDESKPDCGAQLPLSLLEKWLFEEGANQGKEFLSDFTLDDNANFF